jgi:hypothetical protein
MWPLFAVVVNCNVPLAVLVETNDPRNSLTAVAVNPDKYAGKVIVAVPGDVCHEIYTSHASSDFTNVQKSIPVTGGVHLLCDFIRIERFAVSAESQEKFIG